MASQVASNIEALLDQLLTPDNEVIKKATEQLRTLSSAPEFLPSLCTVLSTSQSSQARQYGAVLLRRRIIKRSQWMSLSEEMRNGLKESIFDVLTGEQQSPVRNSLAQLIGTIAHHCDDINEWPQLLSFLEGNIKSENEGSRQIAMAVLKTVSAEAPVQLQPMLGTVLNICEHILHDSSLTVSYYAILVLSNLVDEVSSSEMKQFSDLVPRILEVIQTLASEDEEKACEAMSIFDILVNCEVPILHPHVKTVVAFFLTVAATDAAGNAVRVKALEGISWLVSMKKRALLKMQLIQPILDVVFSLMCNCEDTDDDLEDSEETEKAASYAARILDSLALHLPPEKIVRQVVENSSKALTSEKPSGRKAGYVALGIIAEGCSEHITSKYLEQFLERVVKGFDDPHPGVRNGALFALGQFSEHLQPGIVKYANDLVPLLVNYAIKMRESEQPSIATLTRTYYALEAYVENLEKDVFPFLPDLMQHLLGILESQGTDETTLKLKELSFSCIASIACAARSNLNPYFHKIMGHFQVYLSNFGNEDEVQEIQLQALETLSSLAREMDEETFTPEVTNMCVELGLALIKTYDDPDVRRCVYGLFSSLATLKSTDMVPHLQTIVGYMLESMRSTEGEKVHYGEEENPMLANFDVDDTTEELDTEDDDVVGFSIENAYLEEKEDACTALSDLAIQYYEQFMPYMDECYKEALKLSEYGSSEVSKSCHKALANFAIAVHDYNRKMADELSARALKAMLEELVPKFIDTVAQDTDRSAAMTALHCIQEMLDSIGESVLRVSEDTFTSIISVVKSVLRGKTACQDEDEDDEDEEQAEYDTFLLEYAVGTLPLLARIVGTEIFTPYFADFLPHLLKKCKASCTETERSYAIGTIAECLDMMGGDCAVPYLDRLPSIFISGMTDSDDELRNNSVFALGVLVTTSGGHLSDKYPLLLTNLHELVEGEKSGRVRDNICAAMARVLSAGHSQLPVQEVFSRMLDLLPLTEDFGEYETLCQCLINCLYPNYKPLVVEAMPQVFMLVTDALKTDKLSSATSEKLALMLRELKDAEPERFRGALASVPQDSQIWSLFPQGC
ncbi:importin-4-like [Watersipora subatra]|uniref:importin-4-like n=1 Tax=Watersipora subatra TaxID=2589382 RepID=UPI00355B0DF6